MIKEYLFSAQSEPFIIDSAGTYLFNFTFIFNIAARRLVAIFIYLNIIHDKKKLFFNNKHH